MNTFIAFSCRDGCIFFPPIDNLHTHVFVLIIPSSRGRYLVELCGHKLRDKKKKKKTHAKRTGYEKAGHAPTRPTSAYIFEQRTTLSTLSLCRSKMFASSTSRSLMSCHRANERNRRTEITERNKRVSEQNGNKSQMEQVYTPKRTNEMSHPKHGRAYETVGTNAQTDVYAEPKKKPKTKCELSRTNNST